MTYPFFIPKPKLMKPDSIGTDIAPAMVEELLLKPGGVAMFHTGNLYTL